jgi:hypothetical protein
MATLEIRVEDIRPLSAEVTDRELIVALADGRTITTPLAWYPRLSQATPDERQHVELMPLGLHWPDLDEDLSIAGMLRGQAARGSASDR